MWQILTDAGIDPASKRTSSTWAQFLRSQAEILSTPTAEHDSSSATETAIPHLFDLTLTDAGIQIVLSSIQVPKMNSIAEPWGTDPADKNCSIAR